MTLSTTFSSINSLGDFSFIGGTTYTLKFTVNDQSGSAIDLSTATCRWKLAQYGTDNVILSKTGSVIATNIFEVLLSSADTSSLSGKYSHQPTVEFATGVVVIPAQGIISIVKGY